MALGAHSKVACRALHLRDMSQCPVLPGMLHVERSGGLVSVGVT